MNTVMLTICTNGEHPTLELVRARYGLTEEEIDASFGVVEIDPKESLFTILVTESAASKVQSGSKWAVEGPFSNPRIAHFGPPSV